MIDHETIGKIMEASRIEEVIGDFVSLKKRGANHIGCCPFHNEKTPSFYVSPSKGIFKCFGCGEAGDVVTFLMKHEHYTYPEALRYLAKKYNIEIQEEEQTEEQKERQSERDALFHVSEFAQKHFADLLYNDEMGRAIGLSYFHSRGLSDDVIKTFGLGYCMDEWSAFTDYALKNGYSQNILEKSGLTIVKEDNGRRYDRFRGRVMFPIYSISGRVLGFSGRVLSKEKQAAKYVNSPDSEIYNKSHILYGLYQARNAISRNDKCYLVEGNIDVISMYQSGIQNSVASCGTSLTTEQIRLIKRYTQNITVLYDGDAAGIKAALRAVNMLFEEGMHVRVVLFPDGEDPDSYAQKYGSTQLQEYLASHEDNFIVYKTKVLLEDVKKDPIRKAEAMKEIVNTIALVPDLLERQAYIAQCASLFETPEQTLANELRRTMMQRREKQAEQNVSVPTSDETAPLPDPAQKQDSPNAGNEPSVSSFADPHEVQLIRLLLNYGDKKIGFVEPGENETKKIVEYQLAKLMVDDLRNDELTFDNALCQKIYDMFANGVDEGRLPEATDFATAEPAVRTFAFSLMVDTYRISDLWRKKNIFVAKPEERLKEDLTESLLNFKLFKIDHLIADNDKKIKNLQPDDDVMELLAERKQLNDLRQKLGTALHRVVT